MNVSLKRLFSKTVLLGGLGTAVVLLTALLLLRSDLMLSLPQTRTLLQNVAETDQPKLVVALALLLLLYAVWSGRKTTITETKSETDERTVDPFSAAQQHPPEKVTASRRPITSENLDRRIHRAIHGDRTEMKTVRNELTQIAVQALKHRDGLDTDAATTAIEQGTWTEEHLPAAFLASNGDEHFSLVDRLRLWLDPETERYRRIQQTVAAIRSTYSRGTVE